MKLIPSKLSDAFLVEPKVFEDARGFFMESYSRRAFEEHRIDITFVQDNHSLSRAQGVLRGLHFQRPPHAQCKLLRVTRGAVYDVIVDLRKDSPTFGAWEGFELSEENHRMLLVPKGFAHGFCTVRPDTEVMYKVDEFYMPALDAGILWNDPEIGIRWPVESPVLSEKDRKLPRMAEIETPF